MSTWPPTDYPHVAHWHGDDPSDVVDHAEHLHNAVERSVNTIVEKVTTLEVGGPGITAYTHNQGSPAAVWVIAHPLGFTPNVTVIDSAGTQVEGDIAYAPGTVTVSFNAAFSGIAYLS